MANVTKDSEFKKKNSKKKFSKARKYSKNADTKFTDKDSDFNGHPKCNDVDWYTVSDQLLRDAGSLSFVNPLGNSLRVTELSDFTGGLPYANTDKLDSSIPGVMSMHYIPTIGYSNDQNSAINIAATGLYSAVRADNSGAKNYEPADMMKYLMAVDSAYSLWAFMARIYGVARVYSHVNRYWPKAILTAMHVNADDVYANLANLRYYLNVFSIKLNALCAPSSMPIFKRHFWMNTGIWKDGKNDKSQIYLFVPEYLYKYDETVVPARLTATPIIGNSNTRLTTANLIDIMNEMIDPLLSSEDVGIISGDLFKRYGLDGSFKLASVPEEYEVYPVFSAEILTQIQNVRFIGRPILESIHITEMTSQDGNAGALHQVLNVQSGEVLQNIAHPLNLDEDLADTSPASVMVASRLTAMGTVVASEDAPYKYQAIIDVCGSEVCTEWEVYRILENGTVTNLFSNYILGTCAMHKDTNNSIIVVDPTDAASLYACMSAFNYHPLFMMTFALMNSATNPQSISFSRNNQYYYDFDNYTIVGKTSLRKLHESALLAEFNVPALGQYR